MLFPAIAVAGAVLLMERSACALTVVVAVELLLAGFVSALDDVAVAVLLSTVPFAMLGRGCTVMVNCALPPLASSGIVHDTTPLVSCDGGAQAADGPVFCV